MVTYQRALEIIFENTPVLPSRKVEIEEAVGRILKEDVLSKMEMPPFDKSLMDGYAVNSLDTKKVPVKLKCLGIVPAGKSFKGKIRRGECVKIMTGAPLPKSADSVVILENSRQAGNYVEILEAVGPGKNISFQGESFKRGRKVIEKDKNISLSDVAMLATLGLRFVLAVEKPRVAILNTGGEILPLGAKLAKNKIYNSIGPMLAALCKADGIQPQMIGIARDNFHELKRAVDKGLAADILLVSGGVSKGDYDLVPDVFKALGVKKLFHKVSIKPGKPLFFGVKKKTLVFGIPGNPVPNFLSYFIFIQPAIRKMMGYKKYRPVFKDGIMNREFRLKPGRKKFVLSSVSKKANHYYLFPVVSCGSSDTMALSRADGFMSVDGSRETVKKGSKVKFITWKRI